MRVLFVLLFLLTACVRQPLKEETRAKIDQVGAVSLLGDQLVVDVSSRSLLKASQKSLDVRDWSVDAAFRDLFKKGIVERGRDYVPFNLDSAALAKLAGVRERRFEKTIGRQSQALMDALFDEADRKGMRYFVLLTPPQRHEKFPLHRGTYGAYCDDRGAEDARAYVYFFFDFALYDVAARKKVFFEKVDPSVTEAMTFGDCKVIAELRDPVHQLEDPMRKTMELLVDALFEKMGWRVSGASTR